MKALVTGAAGFIGSTLSEALLDGGWTVRGIDCFTPYYDEARKRSNLATATANPDFELVSADLRTDNLAPFVADVDVVFHQAAQPGVRLSWSDGFDLYSQHNIAATQRLLEAVKNTGIRRFVYASSSSVYGNAARYPTVETDVPAPHSPYGVTKLAAEHLCNLYASNWGVPAISLRYFTVYGPRQRPDMALHRLVESALTGSQFPMYGDGSHVRDFTFVGDVVRANIAAAEAATEPGTVVNVAGGGSTTMAALIALVGEAAGNPVNLDQRDPQPGDVQRTGGSIEKAHALLGWKPEIDIATGVASHVTWMRSLL